MCQLTKQLLNVDRSDWWHMPLFLCSTFARLPIRICYLMTPVYDKRAKDRELDVAQ